MKKYVLLLLLIGCVGSLLHAQKFSAFVSKKQVAVNEAFEVSFKIEGGQGKVNFPKFTGFQVRGGPNTSSSMQFVNGQMSQSYTYSFYLSATKIGKLTIGEASVKVNGKTLKSKPLTVDVVKGAARPATQGGQANQQANAGVGDDIMKQIADNLFLRAYLSKKEAYLGEQITLTYKLFSRVSIVNLNEEDAPKFNGFWVENVKDGNVQFVNEILNGVQYQSAVVRKVILFPQRNGKLDINPYKLKTVVRVRTNSRRSRNIFENVFGGVKDVPFIATAPPISISVNPLPTAGKPANYDGAVGSFTLNASIDKEETQTGDPITLKIKLAGTGNIKNIKVPDLEFPADFEVYDPKVDQRVSTSSGVVSGHKSFDYLIIPRNPGDYKLPPVSFSYFDPKAKVYKTLNGSDFNIKATGEALGASVNVTNYHKDEVELLSQDIRYIKTAVPELKPKGVTFWGSGTFWLMSLLPFLCFAGLFWYKNQQDAAVKDVVGTRMKKATKLAKKRLEAAQKLMTSQSESEFYNEVVRAIWGYLGDKLALGQSELSRDEISKRLGAGGVTDATLITLQGVLDTCEMALFAPTAVEGGMKATYDGAVQLISDLEEELK